MFDELLEQLVAVRAFFLKFINEFFVLVVDATVYVGGLDEKVTEAILWELFLQGGPVGKLFF